MRHFLLLFFLFFLLLIMTDVLNDLEDTLLIDKGSESLAWVQHANWARLRISHEYSAKVVIPNIKER
jgi:hypothetical protein